MSEDRSKKPIRTCIVCRTKSSKYDMIHITRDKAGSVGVDKTGYRQGRGAYICNNRNCIDRLYKTKALNRAFRVSITEETYKELEEELDKGFGDAGNCDESRQGSEW